MKEGKTKTTTKKKTNNKRPSNTKNTNKVKDVEFTPVEEKFLDEDEDDKRLIVFIAIAILIIVGTVIGLLVGCQKEENKEPEKPKNEDVVIPVEPDKEEDKQTYNYEKPLPVVRKVTKKTKKASSNTNNEEETTSQHKVTFYLNDVSEVKEVEDGSEVEKYVPSGYSECSYYTKSDFSEEYTFGEVKEDVNVYMSCSLITYSIVYDTETNNPTSYTVEDNDVTLEDATTDTGLFDGWYTESEGGIKVTTLNKDIVSYADDNNTIYLYARFASNDVVIDPTGSSPDTETSEPEDGDEASEEDLLADGVESPKTDEQGGLLTSNEEEDKELISEEKDSEDTSLENEENESGEKEETEESETKNDDLGLNEEDNSDEQEVEKEEVTTPVNRETPVTTETVIPTIEVNEENKQEEVVEKEEKQEKVVKESKEEKKEEHKEEVKEETEESVSENEE